MDVERPLYRKPLPSTPSSAPTPNTAFKRKPIPVAVTPATPIATGQDLKDKPCPHCGAGTAQEREKTEHPKNDTFAADAQRRISELEAEVKILTGKATAAGEFQINPLLHVARSAFVVARCAFSRRDKAVPLNNYATFLYNNHANSLQRTSLQTMKMSLKS